MAFVYFLMTILTAMLSLIAVRYVIFGAVWTTTGYTFWLFPNMMSEEVRFLDPQNEDTLVATFLISLPHNGKSISYQT